MGDIADQIVDNFFDEGGYDSVSNYQRISDYRYKNILKGIWTTSNFKEVPIKEMKDSHLINSIECIKKHDINLHKNIAYIKLTNELERRSYIDDPSMDERNR